VRTTRWVGPTVSRDGRNGGRNGRIRGGFDLAQTGYRETGLTIPSMKKPVEPENKDEDRARLEEARRIIEEYAKALREIVKKLRERMH
jgi:hypothetical protein